MKLESCIPWMFVFFDYVHVLISLTITSIRINLYFPGIYICAFYQVLTLYIQIKHKLPCCWLPSIVLTWMQDKVFFPWIQNLNMWHLGCTYKALNWTLPCWNRPCWVKPWCALPTCHEYSEKVTASVTITVCSSFIVPIKYSECDQENLLGRH